MIWPFKPRCPLSLTHKVACERRFAALARLPGRRRSTDTAVLTAQDLDAVIRGSSPDQLAEQIFAFVRNRFPCPDRPISVVSGISDAMTTNGAAVMYACDVDDSGSVDAIRVHPALTEFPERLAGVVTAATAECFLRSEHPTDSVPVGAFEILPVFFGLGPIMVNAALHEFSEGGAGFDRWDLSRVGHVSSLEFGYTMALADWALQTGNHDVSEMMRLDARDTLLQGLRFLEKTGSCYFDRDVIESGSQPTTSDAAARLRSSDNSRTLGTLHDLVLMDAVAEDLVEPITEQLNHREEEIQRLAAAALGRCASLTRPVHDELLMMAEDAPLTIRRAAVAALRPGFENDDQVLETLSHLLKNADATSAAICIQTLLKYTSYPDGLIDSLMKGLSCMVLTLGSTELQPGVNLLCKLTNDATAAIHRHFDGDPTALAIFDEILEMSAAPETELKEVQ